MVVCLERGADLHTAQLMPLPLTVSCFNKIQIGATFLVPAHLVSPAKRAVKGVCVCVCVRVCVCILPFCFKLLACTLSCSNKRTLIDWSQVCDGQLKMTVGT